MQNKDHLSHTHTICIYILALLCALTLCILCSCSPGKIQVDQPPSTDSLAGAETQPEQTASAETPAPSEKSGFTTAKAYSSASESEKISQSESSVISENVWQTERPAAPATPSPNGFPQESLYAEPTTIFDTEYTVSEMILHNNGLKIFGELFMPISQVPVPVAILSHGLGVNRNIVRDYASALAGHGIAAYIFDFPNGGTDIESDGTTLNMSVSDESADLDFIINNIKALPEIDPEKIFLIGESQGALVSALTAGDHQADILGLILLYPAFNLPDLCHVLVPDPADIPEKIDLLGTQVGRKYIEDIFDVDIYSKVSAYTNKVLIIHGTDDEKVPISYSENAAALYKNAELVTIDGAGHGFFGEDGAYVSELMVYFIHAGQ